MLTQYTVDAFTDRVFRGNPAAVNILQAWLPEEQMLQITRENNLSETAFAVREGEGYRLRWFTPGGEIDLCGHATLATAYVILRFYEPERTALSFFTRSGLLTVEKTGALYEMRFPAYPLRQVPVTDAMAEAMGARPREAWLGRDLLCVFDREETVRSLSPNMDKLLALDGLLLQVTAPGREWDCVSRSFAPKLRIPEDPVCGSGHCHIIPYWARVTGKTELRAWQASPRGGELICRMEGDTVCLAGRAALYARSELYL